MKKLINLVLVLLLLSIPLISFGQTINFDKEIGNFSVLKGQQQLTPVVGDFDVLSLKVYPKYGCDIYMDEKEIIKNGNIISQEDDELEEVDLSGDGLTKKRTDVRLPTLSPFNQDNFSVTFVVFYKGTPFTGKILSYYENGKLKWEQSFLNGLSNGVFITYYDNGMVMSKGQFTKNILEGNFECYCGNGAKEIKTFIGNSLTMWSGYFANGELFFKDIYKDNKLYKEEFKHDRIKNGWNNTIYTNY